MQEKMKKIGRDMALWMGLIMSFCLSLVGTLTSGHFTPVGWLISFAASVAVSLIIGFLVPVGKISGDFTRKRNMQPGKIGTRCVESLISDLIYTPVITLVMVVIAYAMAMKMSGGKAQIPFLPMLLSSLAICFATGFVLIFLIQPVLLKMAMKKHGVTMPGGPAGGPRPDERNKEQ